MKRTCLAIAGLALASQLTSQAPLTEAEFPKSVGARTEATEFQNLVVRGKAAKAAIKKVTSLKWHKTVNAARRDAKRTEQPILWIQAYGALKRFT